MLRDPFLQFVVLGGIIFLLFGLFRSEDPGELERRISVDGPTQKWLYDNFSKQFRRPPTRFEMGALIQSYINDEVKYRESLGMGLDARDTIVRRRMMQKFDFLFGAAGMEMTPNNEVLERWYAENAEEFAIPGTVTFTHRWFSPDNRGAATKSDAAQAVSALKAGESVTGDSFPFDLSYKSEGATDIRRLFGPEFATAVFEAPLNEWTGPIASGLGYHAVLVTAKTESFQPDLADIREAILASWRFDESKRVLVATLEKLRSEYTIEIDEAATGQFEFLADPENLEP